MNLDRIMAVLETLAIAGRPLSPAELESMTDLPRPTCYRLLQTLAKHQFLDETDAKSRFVIGKKLVQVTLLAKNDADIGDVTSPALKDAASRFGEAVFLSRFKNDDVSIIRVETPRNPATPYVHPGLGRRPLHACSCSKVIAAFADDAFQERVMQGPMKAYTNHTHTTRETLEKEFEKIRELGYAECVEEIETGVSSVAAPVQIGAAGALFSVGTIGPTSKFNPGHRRARGEALVELAREVSSMIQFNGQVVLELKEPGPASSTGV